MTISPARPKLKTAFKNVRTIDPLHTYGPVAITLDGEKILTCVSEEVLLTNVSLGTTICRFATDSQNVTALCISPSSTHAVVFTSSISMRVYEIPSTSNPQTKRVQPLKLISRAHDAPVHVCKMDPTSTYLASGSADGVVKVWDTLRGHVTHIFKGHGGVVSALVFNYPRDSSAVVQSNKMQLITASVDTRIRIFDLSASSKAEGKNKPEAVLDGHVSVPRGLDISPDGRWLISGGRDSVVMLWELSYDNLSSSKGRRSLGKTLHPRLVKTIPALERIEAVGFLRSEEDIAETNIAPKRFYSAGEKGTVKIWDSKEGVVLFTLGQEEQISDDQEEQRQIVDAIYLPLSSQVVAIHADQNILVHSLDSRSITRQMIGFNDEIVDITYLSAIKDPKDHHGTYVAVATNSSLIRVYSSSTLDARLLSGHQEIVLCLDHAADGRILASGSKDRSARLWAPPYGADESWGWKCIAVCQGHTESIGAIAMARKVAESGQDGHLSFMFTGSQDRTIKMWDLSSLSATSGGQSENEEELCKSLTTHKAHEKDINSLDVAPNDKFLASGSQDRTAKVYEIIYTPGHKGKSARGELKLLGVCKGHKKGVWSVRFGRTERVLATGSGDKTIKLWSLDDHSCVKTFEGHTNSVLRVDFLNSGMQLVSAASDGLVKLWNVREEECVTTMDNHQDKVWALAVSSDERTIVSGGADSVVTFWEDCTVEQETEKEEERVEIALKEQDFSNYVLLNDYRRAIQLALAMKQPGRLLTLFTNVRASALDSPKSTSQSSITGDPSVDDAIRSLAGSEVAQLLRYVRDWNTNAKTCGVAQCVLHAVVKLNTAEDVMRSFNEPDMPAFANDLDSTDRRPKAAWSGGTALKEIVDALIPYTERHLARMDRLMQESYVVDYILGEMDDGMFDGDFDTDSPDVMNVDS